MARKYLKDIKMPEMKKDPMLEMDDSEMMLEDMPAEEEEMSMEEMKPSKKSSALADISDDELLMEAKKRGLKIEMPEMEIEMEEESLPSSEDEEEMA